MSSPVHPNDWSQLGIEPTVDLAAVKRAYALRLRNTRPDDDPAAYQRLREAYDRIMAWLKRQHSVIAAQEADRLAPSPEVLEAEPAHEPAKGMVHENVLAHATRSTPLEPADTPKRLADEFAEARRMQGLHGLQQAWPALRARLDHLPLLDKPEASARFADLVINDADLPVQLLTELKEHFGWTLDFRSERWLGSERATALQARLDDVLPRPITDPFVRWLHRHLLAFHESVSHGQQLRALLLAVLVGIPMRRLVDRTVPAMLRRLGMDEANFGSMNSIMGAAQWVRAGLIVAAIVVFGWFVGAEGNKIAGSLVALGFAWLVATRGLRTGVYFVTSKLQRRILPDTWSRRLALSGLSTRMPAIGIALLAFASASFMWSASHGSATAWLEPFAVLLVPLGVILAWPEHPEDAFTCMLLWLYLVAASAGSPSDTTSRLWLFGGGVWCLTGTHLVQSGASKKLTAWLAGPKGSYRQRSDNALGGVVTLLVLVPILPMLMLMAARQMGQGIILGGLAFGIALPTMHASPGVTWWAPMLVPVSVAMMAILQVAAVRLVDARWPKIARHGGRE